jgi:hypothetical protein
MAQIIVNDTGCVGIYCSAPHERLQIGDRFTFHNGNAKVLGYNFYYTGGLNKRLVNDEVALIKYEESGAIQFVFAESGAAGSTITSFASALYLKNDAKVGMGRIPLSNKLEVEGSASKTTSGYWSTNSDSQIKTDITDIFNAKQVILNLHPVKFKYTEEHKAHCGGVIEDRFYYNFIAQEYMNVFPDDVKLTYYDTTLTTQILQINTYSSFIIAIKALQEVIAENQAQQTTIDSLINVLNQINYESPLNKNSDIFNTGSNTFNSRNIEGAILYQNEPNPFSINTKIKYFLPKQVSQAQLLIFDMQGALIKTYHILSREQGNTIVTSGELNAGMYIYTLVADGIEVDSKRMILTD